MGVSDRENKLYLFPDRVIDKLVSQGEELIENVNTFHINSSLAVTSYLMRVARYYKDFCEEE